jgi:Asp/Glu/hydantoin racemase
VLDEAHKLIAQGATAITTSCGFLSPLQDELQAALPVPVITSALWLLPRLRQRARAMMRSSVSSPTMPGSCPHITCRMTDR